MCNGFGAIIDKDFNLYFCEPVGGFDCSHSDIIKRLGWKENTNQHLRNFVRVQCPDWTDKTFEFDERETLPGWVDEERIKGMVERQLGKISQALAEYERIKGPALAEYERIQGLAWAEYERIQGPAWAEYERIQGLAWAEYERIQGLAWAEYERIKGLALAEYERIKGPALAEYERIKGPAWAEFCAALKKLPGYVA